MVTTNVVSRITNNEATNKHKKHIDTQFINRGQEDELEFRGYKFDRFKAALTWTFYIFTVGFLRLIFHWYPHWKIVCTHKRNHFADADKILIVENYQGKYKTHSIEPIKILSAADDVFKYSKVDPINQDNPAADPLKSQNNLCVRLEDGSDKEMETLRVIFYKKVCYVWDREALQFLKLVGLDVGTINVDFSNYKGFTDLQQSLRRVVYGFNEINVPIEGILKLVVLEALTPFYIFQVFSLVVWFAESYYYYTIAIIAMSLFGIGASVVQTRKNQQNLRGTVQSSDKITVSRGTHFEEIPTNFLVPGDVIAVPSHNYIMQCDAVLLNGSCVVNESMLTGESVPVTKTPMPKTEVPYSIKSDGNHTIFCGTKIIQTRYYGDEKALAVVIRTGYLTSKGQLVRSIMYPPPSDFKFDRDAYKFIGILAVLATLGLLYTVVSKIGRAVPPLDILIKALDLFTIAIPPALPATMTVGKLYALARLKKSKIFCINSRVINVSGSINCVCFDKTGTLTEDGLDLWGVVPSTNHQLEDPIKIPTNLDQNSSLFLGMLTCHSLTTIDGNISGDPLDVKMFESTRWVLEDADNDGRIVRPSASGRKITIVHQFQFTPSLQRMSVVAQIEEETHVFCKGAPETIMRLSRPETVPPDIMQTLNFHTEKGYRVIAMASKKFDPRIEFGKISRDTIETDLEFAGLIILENRLKAQTTPTIKTLKSAAIKIVMITGDNVLTALSVAKECEIIDGEIIEISLEDTTKENSANLKFEKISGPSSNSIEMVEIGEKNYCFAVTGPVWAFIRQNSPDLLPKIVTRGAVFARMSSDQKQQLIVELQNLGYYVAMCGDGANDCGALKAAHVGVSLSEAEASVASPLTSKIQDISCVPRIVREGRAALITSFGIFKFMICYSVAEFMSTLILYGIDSNLTSQEFLFIDICLILNFASVFGNTQAYDGPLVKTPPTTSLLSFVPLISMVFQAFFTVFFQLAMFFLIQTYDWYVPFQYDPEGGSYSCYENVAVFSISMFQYIAFAVAFSKGHPYRKRIYTNRIFTGSLMVMTMVCAYITMYPANWIVVVLELKMPPGYDGRYIVLILGCVNFACCVLTESLVVEYFLREKCAKFKKSKKKYLAVEDEIKYANWPVVGSDKNTVIVDDSSETGRGKNGIINPVFEI